LSIVTKTELTEVYIKLYKQIISKVVLGANDIILLNELNEYFFSFSTINKLNPLELNKVFDLVKKIQDKRIQYNIFRNYVLQSPLAVLKLKQSKL